MPSNDSRAAVTPVRVLLLEDDAPFCSLLVELFAGEGLEVAACQTYAALRQAIRSGPKSVVVADFWGASQTALSQCEADQLRELGSAVPTVLLTGRAWASTVSADELNLACILPKPINLDELIAQVRFCLGATHDI